MPRMFCTLMVWRFIMDSFPRIPYPGKFNAECKGQGKRAVRVCPAPLQALLRKGWCGCRSPPPGVLREADPGAQAQEGGSRQAPPAQALARARQPQAALLKPHSTQVLDGSAGHVAESADH